VLLGRWLDLYLMVLPSVAGLPVTADAFLFVGLTALAAALLIRRPLTIQRAPA
jgi:hypothetical protein